VPNRRLFLKVIATTLVVAGQGVLLLLDVRNPSRGAGAALGRGAGYYDGASLQPPQQHEAAPDLTGSVTGSLVDDSGASIGGIEVELMPLDEIGDRRWYATKHYWTDAGGQYVFSRVEPGEYIVAMQMRGAPDGRHPFAGTYYPGVDAESDADRIYVVTGSALELHPVRLMRVATVTLQVNVEFDDGTRPNWSNLLFHNLSFTRQAVIGDEAPGVENGKGEFTLPLGYDYYARAKVDCGGGPRIETRESRPVQRLHVVNGSLPDELTFIIPGSPCPLWSPK